MTRLHFSIGGDKPFPFTIDSLPSGQVELRRNASPETELIEVPAERWERFWREVEKIGVWKWKKKYSRKIGEGGSTWDLELASNDRKLKASGRNAYPEAEHPGGEMNYPPGGQFDRFIQAISRLAAIPVDQIGSEPSDYD